MPVKQPTFSLQQNLVLKRRDRFPLLRRRDLNPCLLGMNQLRNRSSTPRYMRHLNGQRRRPRSEKDVLYTAYAHSLYLRCNCCSRSTDPLCMSEIFCAPGRVLLYRSFVFFHTRTATSVLRWELKPYAKLCLDSWLGHFVLGFEVQRPSIRSDTPREGNPLCPLMPDVFSLNYLTAIRMGLLPISSGLVCAGGSCRWLSHKGMQPL